MAGVDGAHRGGEPRVERADDRARLVGRLVHQVVARHPRVAAVAVGDRLPQMHDAVLEVRVLPEQRPVGRVVRVPVVVLPARQGVQVDDAVDPVRGARRDRPVEVAEAVLDDLERPRVGLQVAVVDRDAHAVEAEPGEERGVGLAVELRQQPLEEEAGALLPEHVADRRAHHRLVRGVARDEVLHVEPAADVHARQADGVAAVVDDAAAVGAEGAGRLLWHRITVAVPCRDARGGVRRRPRARRGAGCGGRRGAGQRRRAAVVARRHGRARPGPRARRAAHPRALRGGAGGQPRPRRDGLGGPVALRAARLPGRTLDRARARAPVGTTTWRGCVRASRRRAAARSSAGTAARATPCTSTSARPTRAPAWPSSARRSGWSGTPMCRRPGGRRPAAARGR